MEVRHDEEVRGSDVGTARCVGVARQLQHSNVDDGAMHAAREGGGASIGDATFFWEARMRGARHRHANEMLLLYPTQKRKSLQTDGRRVTAGQS